MSRNAFASAGRSTTEEYAIRLRASPRKFASVHISESKFVPFASNRPTTLYFCGPNWNVSPTFVFTKRWAIRRATITSFRPGLNIRPSTILMYGRSSKAIGVTPRTVMLAPLGLSFFGNLKMITSSGEIFGSPLPAFSIPGSARMIRNASFVTQLDSSASAPSRMIIRFSFDPEETIASFTP